MVMGSDDLREILWGDRERRTRTAIVLLFLILCISFLIIVRALDIETEVIRDRYVNAETIFSGVFPVTEYPPLVLVFIAIPRLFGSTPWGYETAYVAQMFYPDLFDSDFGNQIHQKYIDLFIDNLAADNYDVSSGVFVLTSDFVKSL